MTAPDARNEAVQFLYKHGELTYSAAAAAIAKLCNNGFHITRVPLAEALATTLAIALSEHEGNHGVMCDSRDPHWSNDARAALAAWEARK